MVKRCTQYACKLNISQPTSSLNVTSRAKALRKEYWPSGQVTVYRQWGRYDRLPVDEWNVGQRPMNCFGHIRIASPMTAVLPSVLKAIVLFRCDGILDVFKQRQQAVVEFVNGNFRRNADDLSAVDTSQLTNAWNPRLVLAAVVTGENYGWHGYLSNVMTS